MKPNRSYDSFPLLDGGVPVAAVRAGLAFRFHYWCGVSGRRYLFTAVSAEALADFHDAVVVLARRGEDGLVGCSIAAVGGDDDPERLRLSEAMAADRRLVAFIHLLAPDSAHRQNILSDLLGRLPLEQGMAA
jgi:hypothetical protein